VVRHSISFFDLLSGLVEKRQFNLTSTSTLILSVESS
jgi:hypothetical protein